MKKLICLISIITLPLFLAAETIDIFEEGISNATKDGEQKDYQEALMDAKRKAVEKAGVSVKSKTELKNFQVEFDYIESQAEAVLLPGYQVKKIGYAADGSYHVVLLGKVKRVEETKEEGTSGMAILFSMYISPQKDFEKFLVHHATLVIDGKIRRKFTADYGPFVYHHISGIRGGKHTYTIEYDVEEYEGITLAEQSGSFKLRDDKHCFFRLTWNHDKKAKLITSKLSRMSDLGGRVKSTHCMLEDDLLDVIDGLNAQEHTWE